MDSSEALRQALLGYHYTISKYRNSLGVYGIDEEDIKKMAGTLDLCLVNMQLAIEDLKEKLKEAKNES